MAEQVVPSFHGIIGRSPAMLALFRRIERVAPVVPVLIQGETGTGKELVARAIWQLSAA
jgi:two-component system, NtrC family, response regulator AtoC